MNEETIFAAALEKKTATERQAFLDEACAGNADLRSAVNGLLLADAAAGSAGRHGRDRAHRRGMAAMTVGVLWLVSRAAGIVALVLLTTTVVLGTRSIAPSRSATWPRWAR